MNLAEDHYGQFPEQLPDKLDYKNPPNYQDPRGHSYTGSAANLQ